MHRRAEYSRASWRASERARSVLDDHDDRPLKYGVYRCLRYAATALLVVTACASESDPDAAGSGGASGRGWFPDFEHEHWGRCCNRDGRQGRWSRCFRCRIAGDRRAARDDGRIRGHGDNGLGRQHSERHLSDRERRQVQLLHRESEGADQGLRQARRLRRNSAASPEPIAMCQRIAESVSACQKEKVWHAFLSTGRKSMRSIASVAGPGTTGPGASSARTSKTFWMNDPPATRSSRPTCPPKIDRRATIQTAPATSTTTRRSRVAAPTARFTRRARARA